MALLVAAAGAGVFFARREKPRPDVDPFRAVDYALVLLKDQVPWDTLWDKIFGAGA